LCVVETIKGKSVCKLRNKNKKDKFNRNAGIRRMIAVRNTGDEVSSELALG